MKKKKKTSLKKKRIPLDLAGRGSLSPASFRNESRAFIVLEGQQLFQAVWTLSGVMKRAGAKVTCRRGAHFGGQGCGEGMVGRAQVLESVSCHTEVWGNCLASCRWPPALARATCPGRSRMGIERRGKDTDGGNVSISLCSEGAERNGPQARGWLEVKVACLRRKF